MDEKLPERSNELGNYFQEELKKINNPIIKEVRGKGLFIGMELTELARPYCEKLMEKGLLCKETHDYVIRFAPPLLIEHFRNHKGAIIIEKEEIDWALERIREVLEA